MLKRRTFSYLGLSGLASAILSWPARLRAAGSTAGALRPVLTPFLDELPYPPEPIEFRGGFADLDPKAAQAFADPGRASSYRIVAEVRSVKFHSQLPATEIWGYRDDHPSSTRPWRWALGPTFKRTLANNDSSGTIVRHVNNLPPVLQHRGFGEPRTTVHLHGGHHPARSDGFPTDMVLADGSPFKVTFEHGEQFDYAYPLRDPGEFDDERDPTLKLTEHTERPSTLWYHDHILDFTAQNVYRGLAGFFLVFDKPIANPAGVPADLLLAIRDTNDETNAANAPYALRLPSGAFDIPLVFQEKTFGANGELVYDVFNQDGFLGDKYLVNGMVQPYLKVKRRKYRFRFLNGSNARIYQMFLADAGGRSYPMTQIATEGGLLSRPVTRPSFLLGMAERVEVVIDFRDFASPKYSELFIENRLVQDNGRGPSGTFEKPDLAARGTQLLKFILENEVPDPSQVGITGKSGLELRPFAAESAAVLSRAPIRNFVFERRNGMWVVNGQAAGDLSRVVATPTSGRGEIWRLINKSGGWWHPIHVHSEFMHVLKRNGKLPFDGTGPDFGQSLERDGLARKDTVVLGPNSEVEVFVEFHDHKGPWVFHCHNIEHEDHAMMARFDVI
jgi:FtsP/CotA-like multicopper oxidase with cupredoxin domain